MRTHKYADWRQVVRANVWPFNVKFMVVNPDDELLLGLYQIDPDWRAVKNAYTRRGDPHDASHATTALVRHKGCLVHNDNQWAATPGMDEGGFFHFCETTQVIVKNHACLTPQLHVSTIINDHNHEVKKLHGKQRFELAFPVPDFEGEGPHFDWENLEHRNCVARGDNHTNVDWQRRGCLAGSLCVFLRTSVPSWKR